MQDPDEKRYWPFPVLPPEEQTHVHRQEIAFLETGYREGFAPYVFWSENFGADTKERGGEIIYRGKSRRELIIWTINGGMHLTALRAYLDDFDCAAEAVLRWLRGEDVKLVLAFLEPHLAKMAGAKHTFVLYDAPATVPQS